MTIKKDQKLNSTISEEEMKAKLESEEYIVDESEIELALDVTGTMSAEEENYLEEQINKGESPV